jgi:uncharacterized protein YfaS (alpha-2-macroglobulin family)
MRCTIRGTHSITIDKKSEGALGFTVAIPEDAAAGRYTVTANVVFAGNNYGEIAEGIVDVEPR